MTSAQFIKRLQARKSEADRRQLSKYFKTGKGEYAEGDQFIGVRMGTVFQLAKEFIDMPLPEIEKLLRSPIHEARAGALSIMNQQARRRKTSEEQRKKLFDLYLRNTKFINNWDLVDVSAPWVIGRYLVDKPRRVLDKLVRSKNLWERRTAIVATGYLVRYAGELDDTFRLAERLLRDREDLIHKATGWMLRETGRKDRKRLLAFLDKHAATMPRTALRYAIEHLDAHRRASYMAMKAV